MQLAESALLDAEEKYTAMKKKQVDMNIELLEEEEKHREMKKKSIEKAIAIQQEQDRNLALKEKQMKLEGEILSKDKIQNLIRKDIQDIEYKSLNTKLDLVRRDSTNLS